MKIPLACCTNAHSSASAFIFCTTLSASAICLSAFSRRALSDLVTAGVACVGATGARDRKASETAAIMVFRRLMIPTPLLEGCDERGRGRCRGANAMAAAGEETKQQVLCSEQVMCRRGACREQYWRSRTLLV